MKVSLSWACAALLTATAASGQEAHKAPAQDHKAPAQETPRSPLPPPQAPGDSGRTKHGIVLRRPAKDAHAPASGTHGTTKGALEPVRITPAASPERVASAIAEAIRSAETKKTASPTRSRTARQVSSQVPQRRYTVQWPSERFEVEWPEPENRVRLAWTSELE